MLVSVGSVISCLLLHVELDGVAQTNIIEINTETGRTKRYKQDSKGGLVQEGDQLVLEEVYLPVDKLLIYLVKPK